MIKKIIINGRACSGKDTIADYLVKKYGFEKYSFADDIYIIARQYFNMKTKDRRLLQQIGDKMREIDPDVWAKTTFDKLEDIDKAVIPDCRRSNEYKFAIKHAFYPIRVFANLDVRIQRAIERDGEYPDLSLWENESEVGADNCKYYYEIDNNYDFNYLYDQIDEMLKMER